jgi:hypothetical protein
MLAHTVSRSMEPSEITKTPAINRIFKIQHHIIKFLIVQSQTIKFGLSLPRLTQQYRLLYNGHPSANYAYVKSNNKNKHRTLELHTKINTTRKTIQKRNR